jgi:2-polyprenyl-3-methyl-5-hydroxy-6-metoxy-1,4-benzoquinol methylase
MPDRRAAPAVQGKSILERYEDLYGAGELSLSRNYSDKFPFLEHLLKPEVIHASVLDFGCGPGRLSFMLARWAERVQGIDFSENGVQMARLLQEVTGFSNVDFRVGDLGTLLGSKEAYDVIVVAGTLEHLVDPVEALRVFRARLSPGGRLLVQVPSFGNFRGDIYNSFLHLVRLPMSLTDLWQITPTKMREWGERAGFTIGRVVGAHYALAFLDRGKQDLEHRVKAAARDGGVGDEWDYGSFSAWMEERVAENELLVEHLARVGVLREVPASPPLPARRPSGLSDELWGAVEEYLTYSGWRERFYTDIEPFNYFGASAAYFLEPDPLTAAA